jgi:hypothetical protein
MIAGLADDRRAADAYVVTARTVQCTGHSIGVISLFPTIGEISRSLTMSAVSNTF